MNPDGLSYLDIASNVVRSGPRALVNTYWSPAYPALIAAVLFVFRPSPEAEVAFLHGLNWFCFALALGAFTYFFTHFLSAYRQHAKYQISRSILVPFGFAVFLFFSLTYIGLEIVSPDLLVAASMFLSAGLACRITFTGKESWKQSIAFGSALALGYYVKAVMFPLGVGLIALTWFTGRKIRRRLIASGAVFLGLCAPWVATVSIRAGHPTFSDVTRLAFVWYTNRRDLLLDGWTWNGLFGHAFSRLAHPPRVLASSPLTLEYDGVIPGTWPVWYEPAYWWSGYPFHLDLRQQAAAIRRSLHSFATIVPTMNPLTAGAILLLLFSRGVRGRPPDVPGLRILLIWPAMAICAYALLWIETRYLGCFPALFWIGVYMLLLPRSPRVVRSATPAVVAGSLILMAASDVALVATNSAISSAIDSRAVADRLHALGLREGSRFATVGPAFDAYYARLIRARVVSHIEDPDALWRMKQAERARFEAVLTAARIEALVSRVRPQWGSLNGWVPVPLTPSGTIYILCLAGPAKNLTASVMAESVTQE